MWPTVLAVAAAVFSGVNTAVVLRLVFRAGVWFGTVNARFDAGEASHRDILARLGRLETLALQTRGQG